MSRRELHPERGSALLITMIIITVVGSIAFALGASSVRSFRQQTQIEDSLNAYEAATAGLEDGLLRWRFDKDTETPRDRSSLGANESGAANCPSDRPTTTSAFYDRVNLTTGEVTYCVDPDQVSVPDPAEIVYDLKIQYRKDPGEAEVVEETVSSDGSVPALRKDAVVEYSVGEVLRSGQGLSLLIRPRAGNPLPNDLLEITAFNADGVGIDKHALKASQLLSMVHSPQLLQLATGTERIRMKYFGQAVARYELHAGQNSPGIDSRITTIESTGYFGGAKRKLSLELDRESGKVLSLFDFVLYSDTTGIE